MKKLQKERDTVSKLPAGCWVWLAKMPIWLKSFSWITQLMENIWMSLSFDDFSVFK